MSAEANAFMGGNQKFCCIDVETFSEIDLKKVGAYEYARHRSTLVICATWRIGTRETLPKAKTHAWLNPQYRLSPEHKKVESDGKYVRELYEAFDDPDTILVAHNAFFEQCMIRFKFYPKVKIPPERWLCTAALAGAIAIPRKLEGCAKVLELDFHKDMSGHRLMLKMSKPRKPTKNDPSTVHKGAADVQRLVAYCKTDTNAEVEALLKMPPLSKTERRVWELDQRINWSGPRVDRPLVLTTLRLIAEEMKRLDGRVKTLTDGQLRLSQRDKTLAWLESEGCFLPDLKKKTVEDAIKDGLAEGKARTLLKLRLSAAKTSTAKYKAFDLRSQTDGVLRDILVYHRASTGRWGGAGVQPQNLPRPHLEDTTLAADVIREGDLEWVRLLYGDPMAVFSSCLRAVLIPTDGHRFHVADYSAIEARVLFWFADHEEGMRAFREKRDLYREMAAKIFNVDLATVDDHQRFLGKASILGAGFGLGPRKFQAHCESYGVTISLEMATAAIQAYRKMHHPVPVFWKNIERAAAEAVKNPGTAYSINHTKWWVKDEFLWCRLPSGRKLAYFRPSIKMVKNDWGSVSPTLFHWGEHPKTKQWVEVKTWAGPLVNNLVQATARDLMASAMLRIDADGRWRLVLSVHDELVAETADDSTATLGEFFALMEQVPSWAAGCPVAVAGWEGPRYRKG